MVPSSSIRSFISSLKAIISSASSFLAGDGIGAVDVLHGEDAQNVPETEKKTDPVSGADAVVSADVAENVVATESADQTSVQTVAQTEALAEAADPAIPDQIYGSCL